MNCRPINERVEEYLIDRPNAERLLIHPDDVKAIRVGEMDFKKIARLIKKFGLPVKILCHSYVYSERDLQWLM